MNVSTESGLATYFERYRQFGDPMLLPSMSILPKDHRSVMDYAVFLYHGNRPFANACARTCGYFITKLNVRGKQGDARERTHWLDFMTDKLNLIEFLRLTGEELSCYGNAFPTIYYPFDRFLVDNRGGSYKEWSVEMFPLELVKFEASKMRYLVPDPRQTNKSWDSRTTVSLPFVDRPSYDLNRMSLRIIDPREVILLYSISSGDSQVIRRFGPAYRAKIMRNDIFEINRTPRKQLEAIVKGRDFLYDERAVFHMKAPTISGISNGGWGLPPAILQFANFFQLQAYRKADEAIAMDYMLPFRIISPDFGSADIAVLDTHFEDYAEFTDKMIKRRRVDPFAMFSVPFPIRLTEAGATGKMYSPKDLIQITKEDIHEAAGYPIEMWRGTMAFHSVPTALRLFESQFGYIYRNFNALVKWINTRISDYVNRDRLEVELERPSLADDLDARSVMLSLMQSGEISLERGMKMLNIDDPIEEMRRRVEEDSAREIIKAEGQQRLEQRLASGVLQAPESDPNANSNQTQAQTTPQDQMAEAQNYAMQALQSTPGESQRLLRFLMSTRPELHALTKEFMERFRRQAEAQGRAQLQAGR